MTNPLILKNIILNKYTTYGAGGAADFFSVPKNNAELAEVLDWALKNGITFEIIGGGSNLLISDKGYRGLIICMARLNRFIINKGSGVITAGAGLTLRELVKYTVNKGLSGMEYMSGIPGSLGGAIKMNAGAYGAEIKDTLIKAVVTDKRGNIREKTPADIDFGYRKSPGLDNCIVLSGEFLFKQALKEELEEIKTSILKKRKEKQPLHKPSCGSVFKRPEGNYAGTLIESCGLKGYRIGGAMVSHKHANFILNEDNASASDIKNLIDYITEKVEAEKGVRLEPEVRMIGFD